ncbi:MAG: Na+/H+ antiporter nhaP [Rhizobium sp.]|nr:Na+/H+ antiporter nhaP [Rhizobium sp.]
MSAAAQYEFLVFLLFSIFVLELLARRLRLPPAAAFILGGIVLALVPGVPTFEIDPDLVLLIFMPPLLMNGAYFTVWRDFKANISGILLLALGAVAFTTLAVGLAAKLMLPDLPWAVCFALGAIVSPPDAVAAGAVLERLSLPSRMSALLQGESLLNDASGLVLFRFAVAAALTGTFSATAALGSFCLLSIGGVAFGLAVGQVGLFVIRRVRDSELAITATLLLAAVSYVGGERLHVSGVLATVATGLLLGWHQHSAFTAKTRIRSQAFWKVLVFLLESILFILIGLSLRGVLARVGGAEHGASTFLMPLLSVVATVILSRFVWLFGSESVRLVVRRRASRQSEESSFATATVMSWAGMRGVVTLAAALSLPTEVPGRDFVLLSSFAVILVTVLLQGTTLGPLISLLRMTGRGGLKFRQDSEDLAWMRMTEAQFQTISTLSHRPDRSERHPRLLEQFGYRARVAAQYTTDRETHLPQKIEHFNAVIASIKAGRSEILRMHSSGEIHDRVLRDLENELDLQEMVAESHTG